MAPDAVTALEHFFDDDERAQFRGPPRRQQVVGDDPSIPASYRSKDAISFYLQPLPPGAWMNEVTVRSGRLARMYEPGAWIAPALVAGGDRPVSSHFRRTQAPCDLGRVLAGRQVRFVG